ncbi:cytochrome P450 [Marinactinospora thermotolerans]|uniref:Cytochrome P450 n=2 Tax=Marinactinospora thermotolerans TaxID=531310 RepID=A0A1T4S5J4_9ACTN|nr:cytochrome P450 [Marinactinospora thermotolerans]AFO85454.1 P450-like monoxygenase [Marinactinospora thermotolerans]SKA23590.1 Cytochrome P450 [Marinactinospora thermotolerans DSM 45154]
MNNLFADPEGSYVLLVNGDGRRSAWPASAPLPPGWRSSDESDALPERGCPAAGPPDPVPYPFRDYHRLDVDPVYAELRADRPVLRIRPPYGDDAWLVTRYDDVKTVLGDPRFSRALTAHNDESRLTPRPVNTSILGTDPPDHTRLRRLLARAFTARRAELLRPGVRAFTATLIDEMTKRGAPADLVEDFALPLTALVICELLGVPYADRPAFRVWLDAFSSTTALSVEQINSRTEALYAYIDGLVAQRRSDPAGDLISALVDAHDETAGITGQELVELVSVLLIAGYETTSAQLANSVLVLFTHPHAHEALRADPGLLPGAVEELIRFVPLDAHVAFGRYAREDVELSGVRIRAGEAVLPVLPSANRDPSTFPRPDELDLCRGRNPHLGFGYGIHRCIGAPLAKVVLEEGLGGLLARFPGLSPAVPPEEMVFKEGVQVRILQTLPVTW